MSTLKRKSNAFEELDTLNESEIDFDVAYATSGDASASERQKIVDEVRRIAVLADQALRQATASGDELDMSDAERWKQATERWLQALNEKSATHATKDMSTLMEVAKLLGQIGTAGAAMYVGASAARETYDALKAKCREMMDKLDEAQSQLDNIDPRELDAGMRSAPNLNETKSFDQIMNWLYAAGIVFLGGTMLWDNRDRFTARIDDAIEAVREAIMYMRYGSTLEDLQRAIDTLQSAGIQVPGDIQRIAIDPREGNDSEIPSTNIAMARAWLDSALQHLQEAQARAQNMPDEQRSDPHPVSVKSGAHAFYR